MQARVDVSGHFGFIVWTSTAEGVLSGILVEECVAVEIWAVARKLDQAKLPLARLHPTLDLEAAMSRMLVDNDKYLAIGLPYQAPEKLNYQIGCDTL